MSTEQVNYKPLNTVQTVLSQDTVNALESILYWKEDQFWNESLSRDLLKMLEVYVNADHQNTHRMQKPDMMIFLVSLSIELNDQLISVQRDENPLNWDSTPNGWRDPVKEG